MNHKEQESINLREPISGWQKMLLTLFSVAGLFLMVALCKGANEDTHHIAILVGLVVTAIPTFACSIALLYFWRGRKYLVFQGRSMVIHRELLGFRHTRCVVPGRNSRLVMRRVTSADHHDGGSFTYLELHLTDAYGHSHRLLQFSPSQRERMLAIGREICQHFPELQSVQEE